jgi:hypothetical protein
MNPPERLQSTNSLPRRIQTLMCPSQTDTCRTHIRNPPSRDKDPPQNNPKPSAAAQHKYYPPSHPEHILVPLRTCKSAKDTSPSLLYVGINFSLLRHCAIGSSCHRATQPGARKRFEGCESRRGDEGRPRMR